MYCLCTRVCGYRLQVHGEFILQKKSISSAAITTQQELLEATFQEKSPFWGRSSLKCFTTPLGFEHLRSELHRETLFRRKVHHGRLPCGSFLKSLASVYTSIVWCYSIAENMTPSVCFKPTLQLFYCLNLILRDEMQQGLSTSRRHSSQSSMLRDESENGTILNIFGGFWKKK